MHETVFLVASMWMTVLLAVSAGLVVRSGSGVTRILALDMLILILVALLALLSGSRGVGYYLDAALVIALLSFVATLAAARFHATGRLF